MRGRSRYDEDTPRSGRSDFWGVVLEAPDAPALARFYADLLDWEVTGSEPGWAMVNPRDGVAYLACQTARDYVPPVWPAEPDRQQMMSHLDFEVTDLEAAVADALALGATLASFQPQDNVRVLLDPAGHPFCLYRDE
jgi:catechol 2,3-dioxygenase-like lactoylglutathione lyase family enzyme